MYKTFTPTYDTELIQKWYLDQELNNINNLFTGEKPMGNIFVDSIQSKNMFNKNSVCTGYLDNTGTIGTAASYRVSNYIPVVPGEQYTYQGTTIDVSYGSKIGYYDANKQWVGYADIVAGGTTITIPSDVYYMRTTLRASELNTYQIEKGNTATKYTPHQSLDIAALQQYGEATRNSAFTNGTCRYFKIGKFVILIIADLYGNTAEFGGEIFTGLPKPEIQQIFIIQSYTTFSQARLRINANGALNLHYSVVPVTSSGQQFYGIGIYLAQE